MSREIVKEQFESGIRIYQKGKHKLRENKFGIVQCTRCGLLSTSIDSAEKSSKDDCLIVKCN